MLGVILIVIGVSCAIAWLIHSLITPPKVDEEWHEECVKSREVEKKEPMK